jgi:hypothetical protein
MSIFDTNWVSYRTNVKSRRRPEILIKAVDVVFCILVISGSVSWN